MSQASEQAKARQLPLNPLYKAKVCICFRNQWPSSPLFHSEVAGRTVHQLCKNAERRVGLYRQGRFAEASIWLEYNGKAYLTPSALKAALSPQAPQITTPQS